MKIEKSKFIISIIILTILGIMPQAYAKTSIEIKPNTGTYTNKTISEFFDESMAMKNIGEGLECSTVDVHMATNTDWAIFAYFLNSAYGTSGNGKNTGTDVTIGSKTYASTNGNITGVMNFGKTRTYTAGVISNYASILDTAEPYMNGKSIIDNATDRQSVDLINTVSAKAMARNGWYGSFNVCSSYVANPFSVRYGLFGFVGGHYQYIGKNGYHTAFPNGSAVTNYSFRPVIWN